MNPSDNPADDPILPNFILSGKFQKRADMNLRQKIAQDKKYKKQAKKRKEARKQKRDEQQLFKFFRSLTQQTKTKKIKKNKFAGTHLYREERKKEELDIIKARALITRQQRLPAFIHGLMNPQLQNSTGQEQFEYIKADQFNFKRSFLDRLYNTYRYAGVNTQNFQEYYFKIRDELDSIEETPSLVKMTFTQLTTNKQIVRSVKASHFDTFEDFEEYLQDLYTGYVDGNQGSDGLDFEGGNVELDLNMFDILSRPSLEVEIMETKNKFESKYHEFYEQEDNGQCVLNVLKQLNEYCGKKIDIQRIQLEYRNFTDVITDKIFTQFCCKISPLCVPKYLNSSKQDNITIDDEKYLLLEPKTCKLRPIIIKHENHVQLVKSFKPVLKSVKTKDIYVQEEGKLVLLATDKEICDIYSQEMRKRIAEQEKREEITIKAYFDAETIVNPYQKNILQDATNVLYLKKKLNIYLGIDSVNQMVNTLLKDVSQNETCILQAFNGSKFDFYLLADKLIQREVSIDSLFCKSNQILSLDFNNNIKCFDIIPFVLSSLKDASSDYKLKFQKIELGNEISFMEQQKYVTKKLNQHYLFSTSQEDNRRMCSKFYNQFLHQDDCQAFDFTKQHQLIIDFDAEKESPDDLHNKLLELMQKHNCNCQKFFNFIKYNIFDVLCLYELDQKVSEVFNEKLKDLDQVYFEKFSEKIKQEAIQECRKCVETAENKSLREWKQKELKEKQIKIDPKICEFHLNSPLEKIRPIKTLYDFKTSNSMIWYQHEQNFELQGIKPTKLSFEQFKKIRFHSTAGRVQCFMGNGSNNLFDKSGEFIQVTDGKTFAMIDCISLYPFSYLNNYFPCGEIGTGLDYKGCWQYDKIGYFWVRFSQENCKYTVLPYKEIEQQHKYLFTKACVGCKEKKCEKICKDCEQKKCEKFGHYDTVETIKSHDCPYGNSSGLNWNCRCIQMQFISTEEIKSLINYGATVMKVWMDGGFHFEDKVHGSVLFKQQYEWKQIKIQQDEYKDLKDDLNYNCGQRGVSKLCLNGISGKPMQKIYTKTKKFIQNEYQFNKFAASQQKNGYEGVEYESIQMLNVDKGSCIVVETKNEQVEFNKMQKKNKVMPCFIGNLIYTYARNHMLQVYQYGVKYGDTDSACLEMSDLKRLMADLPKLFGKEFGQFDFEKGTYDHKNKVGLIQRFAELCPKNYFYFKENVDLTLSVIKKGFKGINLGRSQNQADLLCTDKLISEADLEYLGLKPEIKETKDKLGNIRYITQLVPINKCQKKDVSMVDFVKRGKMFDLYQNCDNSMAKTENICKFIRNQVTKQASFILTSSLQKIQNSSQTSGKQSLSIYQNYMVKTIQP